MYKPVMKRILLLSALLFVSSIVSYGQTVITCPDANTQSQQYRGGVKHRAEGNATGTSIKVADMYALPAVSVAKAKAAGHAPMAGSAERRTFTLTGFLWQAKVEGNDCEIHLELNNSRTISTARRVIVEVPADPDFHSDYQAILRLMQDRFPNRDNLGPDAKFTFTPPIHMKITGFGFFDGVHKSMAGPNRPNGGHGSAAVKTFWELHPAWGVEVLTP